jgi:hypothetical protein
MANASCKASLGKGPKISWEVWHKMSDGLTAADLKPTVREVSELLVDFGSLDPMKVIIYKFPGIINNYDDSEKQFMISPQYFDPDGKMNNSVIARNVFSHELAHAYFAKKFDEHFPGQRKIFEKIDHPARFNEIINQEIRRGGSDLEQRISNLRAARQKELLKAELYMAYNEFHSDMVAVLITMDPDAMTAFKLNKASDTPTEQKLKEITNRYRSVALKFGAAEIKTWLEEMNFYNSNALNKDNLKMDRYLLFAPARSWLWAAFNKNANIDESNKRLFIAAVLNGSFRIFSNQIRAIDAMADSNEFLLSPEKLNRDFVAEVLLR